MKQNSMTIALAVALSLGTLAGCSTPSTPAGGGAQQTPSVISPKSASSDDAPSTSTQQTDKAEVTTGADVITVKGSGKAEVGPISFDQTFYLVKVANDAATEYGSVIVTEKGKELPAFMTATRETVSVYRPGSKSVTLAIEATGAYTLTFTRPSDVSSAVSAPQVFKGSVGTTVTPLVKTKGNYVNLAVKYTGTPDPKASTGMMLATATLYDAVSGDSVMNAKYVNKVKTEDSDGNTRSAPGTYFAIVTCGSAADSWEVTIRETSD